MLEALHVHNFALLEDARADFTPGFNIFTGETGSGKSILIDAFGLVLGGRGSVDFVRRGADSLWVQAIFDISDDQRIAELLKEQGIEIEEELFLKRQINLSGKSRSFVNGVQVPIAFLKQLGSLLVDIHGQHENQALIKADAARIAVDSFGGKKISDALSQYKEIYGDYVHLNKKLAELKNDTDNQQRLLDRYAWEIKEIQNSGIKPGEEEELQAEAKLLQHGEKIIRAVEASRQLLDKDKGVLELLADAQSELKSVNRYDDSLGTLADNLDSAWAILEDCRQELADYLDSKDFNGARAEEVQTRLDLYYRLHKKYGGTTEAILDYLKETITRYKELEHIETTIAAVEKQYAQVLNKLKLVAANLTGLREKAAQELSGRITDQIRDLAMPNGSIVIKVDNTEGFTATGKDILSIMFSANLGEPLNSLEKVASGGELSRIALAYKTVMRNLGTVSTMVFDEIDTGVGGVTAQRMAEKMTTIAAKGQVLCITHLPQIAAFADNHIYIEKNVEAGRTLTKLKVLKAEDRGAELVRMAGGNISEAAKENANEMLNKADSFKAKL